MSISRSTTIQPVDSSAPTPSAMRKLLSICDEYAQEFSIKFNAKKSKWLVVIPKKCRWSSGQMDLWGITSENRRF